MNNPPVHASLFSGIGGFDLAAEWLGFRNAFHCEINPFCERILKYHFPDAEHYTDITKTDFTPWRGKIDILSGGFPCQPFSLAGQRKGAEDDRYLWPQMLRAIREIRPAWVVGENVAGILTMVQPSKEVEVGRSTSLFGEDYTDEEIHRQYVVETVCTDLEREGYSVRPFVIPACAVGALHRRDRVFFIAHRADAGVKGMQRKWEDNILSGRTASDTDGKRCNNWSDNWQERPICYDQKRYSEENQSERTERKRRTCENGSVASYSQCSGSGQIQQEIQSEQPNGHSFDSNGSKRNVAYSDSELLQYRNSGRQEGRKNEKKPIEPPYCPEDWSRFPTQSPVCSRDDGISTRLDGIAFSKWRQESIKAYGNAIVPQVMYEIFQAIQETYNQ